MRTLLHDSIKTIQDLTHPKTAHRLPGGDVNSNSFKDLIRKNGDFSNYTWPPSLNLITSKVHTNCKLPKTQLLTIITPWETLPLLIKLMLLSSR